MKVNFTKLITLTLIALCSLTYVSAQNLIYNQDFADLNGLPTGWTSADASGGAGVWEWCDDPSATNPCIVNWAAYNNQHEMGFFAETADNGYVFMDSDALGNVAPNHDVQLTTAALDFSGASEVWIKTESLIGVFGVDAIDNALLRVSTDNATWTDYTLFPDLNTAVRWSNNPQITLNDISDVAAGESTVYIQFQWIGNYEYYWLMDDIEVYDADPSSIFFLANDMQVNDNFFAIAPNAITPASQVEQFGFLSDVENVGVETQTNVNLNITITDDNTSTEVYSEDLSYGDIEGFTIVENVFFPGMGFTPVAEAGKTYTGEYTISSDSLDDDTTNDTQSFDFAISDTLFAKEMGATRTVTPADGNWDDGEPRSWAYGNCFYVVDGTDLNARHVAFGLWNTVDYVGELVTLTLYEWVDTNVDGNADADERTQIAYNFYEITGDEANGDLITLPLIKFPENTIGALPLNSNTNYVIMLEYNTVGSTPIEIAASEAYDYGATVFRSDSLEMPRYPGMLGINGDLTTEPYSSVGFGRDIVPVVRLSVGEALGTVSTQDILSDDNVVRVMPNPATDYINLNLDLVNVQEEAIVRILDVTGKTILQREYDNIQKETFEYSVSNLATGTYFLNLITNEGNKSVRFVVTK
jgi:hypothetical protein